MRASNILQMSLVVAFFAVSTALTIVGSERLSVVEQTQQSWTAPVVRITRSRGLFMDPNEYYSFDAVRDADGTLFHLFTTRHRAAGSTGYMPLGDIRQATRDTVFLFHDDMYAVTVNAGLDWTIINMSKELKVDSECHALIEDVQFDLHGSATVRLEVRCHSWNERTISTTDYGRTWHEVP